MERDKPAGGGSLKYDVDCGRPAGRDDGRREEVSTVLGEELVQVLELQAGLLLYGSPPEGRLEAAQAELSSVCGEWCELVNGAVSHYVCQFKK